MNSQDRRSLIDYLHSRGPMNVDSFDPTPLRFLRKGPPWYLRHATNRNIALVILAALFLGAMVAAAH